MFQQFRLAWRSIWRQGRRTAITVFVITFGLFLIIILTTLEEGMIRSVIDNGAELQAGHVTIEHQDYRLAPSVSLSVPNAESLADDFQQLPQVRSAKLIVSGEGVARSGAGAFGILIAGVVPDLERKTSPLAEKIVEGDYLDDSDKKRIVIGTVLAERLKLKPGKKLVIATNDTNGDLVERLYRVKGIFRTGTDEVDGALIHMQLDAARDLFGLPEGSATQIGLVMESLDRLASFLPLVEEKLAGDPDLAVHPWQTIMPGVAGYVTVERASYMIMEGFLIAMVSFTILNTLLMSVTERKKEFATIIALGGRGGDLRLQVFFEAALIALLGILFGGLLGGYVAYHYSNAGIDLATFVPSGEVDIAGVAVDTTIYPLVTARLMAFMCGSILAVTLLLSLIPISRVTRISIANLLR